MAALRRKCEKNETGLQRENALINNRPTRRRRNKIADKKWRKKTTGENRQESDEQFK